ncbi:MAG: transposon-encoded TnpW family protein [Oscillospiraceae bacterium]|nr:transposon-encoded TnpW family protein [Oscillospiraceae bacterium]
MTKPTETSTKPTAPRKPDGTLTTQINNQTYIIEVFFDHDSKETFQDKLLRVILADLPMAANQ